MLVACAIAASIAERSKSIRAVPDMLVAVARAPRLCVVLDARVTPLRLFDLARPVLCDSCKLVEEGFLFAGGRLADTLAEASAVSSSVMIKSAASSGVTESDSRTSCA